MRRSGDARRTLTRLAGAAAMAVTLAAAAPVLAQGMFSPVITINERAVTGYELDQRIRLLELFRTPGDIPRLARTQLIEDRLKQQELERAGLVLSDSGMRAAMEEFAGRANLSLDQFLTLLGQNGVSEETLRDYVRIGVAWRDYIRQRFNRQVNVTESDIDAAVAQIGATSPTAVEVALSEIIIPAPPERAAEAMAIANRISQMRSLAAFEAAAREYSALPSRDNGGRLGWLPLANYPPALHGLILGLAPGQISQPIPITNGVALFQMRELREGARVTPSYAEIDYAVFHAADAAEAAAVAQRVDTCDDLYGVARGLPVERLDRVQSAPAAIPQDVALQLAGLDADEISTALVAADGTVRLVMLCSRLPVAAEGVDRDAVANQLRSDRLTGYADALLADLRAAATITGE